MDFNGSKGKDYARFGAQAMAALLTVGYQSVAFAQTNNGLARQPAVISGHSYRSPQVFLGSFRTNVEHQAQASQNGLYLQPSTFFISQVNDPKYNRDAPASSADCGPTCLAMIFLRYGLYPDGAQRSNPEGLIKSARLMMTGNTANTGTYASQVLRAVEAIGLSGRYLRGIPEMAEELDKGHSVMAGGCPFLPTSYGPRVGMVSFQSGHWILLVRRAGDQFVACDPMCLNGPINISRGELEAFLTFNKAPCLVDIYPTAATPRQ
jgi:hypothetical protein